VTLPNRWLQVAVALPLLGLVVMIARAEVALRSGPSFRIPIAGYDPRDLLSGHYLQYRFAFDWQGESTCGAVEGGTPADLDGSCCICLTSEVDGRRLTPARQVRCDETALCDGWLVASSIAPPLRYFVPERHAAAIEDALRGRQASLGVTCGPNGQPAIGDLFLDGRPWRDVIDE
jgi:GDYXXLXY motif protein